ncbi:MAG: hypothetical protein WKF92_09655 [Pyrinomonadaceae bacterium]
MTPLPTIAQGVVNEGDCSLRRLTYKHTPYSYDFAIDNAIFSQFFGNTGQFENYRFREVGLNLSKRLGACLLLALYTVGSVSKSGKCRTAASLFIPGKQFSQHQRCGCNLACGNAAGKSRFDAEAPTVRSN